jgi:hypothetical protein
MRTCGTLDHKHHRPSQWTSAGCSSRAPRLAVQFTHKTCQRRRRRASCTGECSSRRASSTTGSTHRTPHAPASKNMSLCQVGSHCVGCKATCPAYVRNQYHAEPVFRHCAAVGNVCALTAVSLPPSLQIIEIHCSHCVSLETTAGRLQMHTGSAMLPLSITTASVEYSAQPGKI